MRQLPLLGLALGILVLVAPALGHAVQVWSTTEEFSFGFLVPPVSALLLWWRRAAVRQSLGAGRSGGLLVVLPALAVYLLAERAQIHALAGASVPPLLIGVAVYLWGWRTGRELAFPIGFLIFGLALFRGLLDSVGFAMQGVTAVAAGALVQDLGVAVRRDGLVLASDNFAFIVAETCSGMSSLVSLLALAALWTYLTRGSAIARAAIIISTLPLVVVANSLRVALVLLVATWYGQDAAMGFFHNLSSLVLFGVALGGLILVSRAVGCRAFLHTPALSS